MSGNGASAVVMGTPTLYPDRGHGDDAHLAAVLQACVDADCTAVSIFGSHVVQAIEARAERRKPQPMAPATDRGAAIAAFQAAILRAPQAWGRQERADVRALVVDSGLRVHAIECLTMWSGQDAERAAREAEAACLVAREFDAHELVAACLEPSADFDALVRGLDLVATIAGHHDLDVVVEWLPGTGLESISATVRLLDTVDRENTGLVVDALHWQCQPGGPDWAALATCDPARIRQVQLSDCALPLAAGVVEPRRRLMPGHGDIDLVRLLSTIDQLGACPVVTCEVFDEVTLMEVGVAEYTRRQMQATRAVVASVPGGDQG
jgi:sugar phosphate isomerase/epimerase